ncbi:hypothetical protein CA839_12140 [Fusobacterium polymorphum]|uniref:Uncharacterized protein n=1 Tax=Fusobacterium nucleatum subsp. polymorphum TaxID=76857 RepID=A0A246ECS1_FUSNP|nr:hypothetical protein [Fusobacterium polymorphum]OWP23737.1 hypothetical protein CA839_12140 [Fusobacterium polymorphum]
MSNLDFKGMIEANYNVLSNLEANIQAFFKTFENVDTKIVEKETAFINAKQEFKKVIEDYRNTLDQVKEDFNLALVKEQKEFIEIANSNTEKILKAKEEELKLKLELEENKIILKAKDLLEAMENFNSNISIKIADIIKNLPTELEKQKDLYINKTLEAIKETSKTLELNIAEYKKLLIKEVNSCKDTLKESTEVIKEVAENIKKENISLNKNRSNLEADYKKVNSSLEKVSKDTNNLIKGINNIKYTFIINKIYILLFSLLNSIFILRIIVPQQWKFNFYGKKTLWTLIIVASLLIIIAICDFMYRTILPILSNLLERICNLLFSSEEETEEN